MFAMMPTKQLTMIRHGESVSNLGLRTADPWLIPLTDCGVRQAATAATKIAVQPDLLVVSSMLRARQSAESLTRRFPNVPFETWDVHEFVYFNLRHETTPQERAAMVDAYWERCSPQEKNPAAESFDEFWVRVTTCYERAARHPATNTLLVGHGLFISAFAWGHAHGFPRCTPEVMKAVRTDSLKNPIPNSAILQFDLTVGNLWHGR